MMNAKGRKRVKNDYREWDECPIVINTTLNMKFIYLNIPG